MRGEPRDNVKRQIAALEIRIGIEHHRDIDGVGDGAEVGLDLRVFQREIGFENGEDAVGAESLIALRLFDRVGGRCRGDAGDHRHALVRGFNGGLDHGVALFAREIGEFAGRAERRQPMHAGVDQIGRQFAQHIGFDPPLRIDGGDEIRINAVKFCHGNFLTRIDGQPPNPPSSRNFCSSGVVARPSTALRCGKRPKRRMMSAWISAHFRLSASPAALHSATDRS